MILYCIMYYVKILYDVIKYNKVEHNTIPYHFIFYNIISCYDVILSKCVGKYNSIIL